MFSKLPNRIKYVFWGTFLWLGCVLMVFAIWGMLGFFQEDLEPLPTLELNTENKAIINEDVWEKVIFPDNAKIATFAAGCFWCTEAAFQEEPGVLDAVSWFAWGTISNPTYDEVVRWKTDYREAVQVTYDPMIISYNRLLEVFRESIDPVDWWWQFIDRWFQYTTAAFRHSEEQKSSIQDSLVEEQLLHEETIATKVLPYTTFTAAEAYHQDFYKNSKERYGRYKKWSGREEYWAEREKKVLMVEEENVDRLKDWFSSHMWYPEPAEGEVIVDIEPLQEEDSIEEIEVLLKKDFIERMWERVLTESEWERKEKTKPATVSRDSSSFIKPSKEELKDQLTYMQYRVTQNDGTEPPFGNEYWDNKDEGIYVDIVSWEPLFSSRDKYKSGTWWPSFTQPIGWDTTVMTTHEDTSLWSTRTELRSTVADSHLWHLFDDGPVARWWLRYCMNSAGMNFVPYEQMEQLGYGEFKQFVK